MMNERDSGQGRWIIDLSLLLSLLLMVWPLSLTNQWLRPEWTALLVIYWIIVCPQRIRLSVILLIGLLLDLLEGSLLGQHALGLMAVSYVCLLSYQRLINYVLWHQALIVFVVIGLYQLIDHWSHSLVGSVPNSTLTFLLPALTSALVWPLVWFLMERVRRHFRIS